MSQITSPRCPQCGGDEFHSCLVWDDGKQVNGVRCENPDCDWATGYDMFMEWVKPFRKPTKRETKRRIG